MRYVCDRRKNKEVLFQQKFSRRLYFGRRWYSGGMVSSKITLKFIRKRIKGYSSSRARSALTAVGYVLTIGILRLIFHWAPHLLLKCTHKTSPLSDATKVLVRVMCLFKCFNISKDSSGLMFTVKVVRSVTEESR